MRAFVDRASAGSCLAIVLLPPLVAAGARVLAAGWAQALFLAGMVLVALGLGLVQLRRLGGLARARHHAATRARQLEGELARTANISMEKSRFIAAASHDLRQPLHALSFFASTLERRMMGSPEQPLIRNMMRSIEALDRSFNAILDISKLDAQAVETHPQIFPLHDLFRRLQMTFGGQAEEAGLHLRFRAGGKVVHSDPQLLERVLANLIQNGLRYCRHGGVGVVARQWKGGINIEVWDTGIGIAPTELPKIFREFYQVSNPDRDRSKGLGLGLAIVVRLVRLLGHELSVRSRAGAGTVFRIWVRSSELAQMEEFSIGTDTVPPPIEETQTILFVDDEETIRTAVAELLRQWGYTVLAVATIAEACSAAHDHPAAIDLMISDLRLRDGEDGLRAVDEVRRIRGERLPALLITGDAAPEQLKRVQECGHVVLLKPVVPRELYEVLQRMA